MAGDRTKVSLIQDLAISMFGEALRMKGTEILRLADRVRDYGTSMTCFFAFVYRTYSITGADRMLYRNFLNAPGTFIEFEKWLENLELVTPQRIQCDWEVYDAYRPKFENDEALLTSGLLPLSPLFRFMLLSSMDSGKKEPYRELAEQQLLENPYYWVYLKDNACHLPLAEEVIYEK